ncbi:carbapenem self-resistance protein CarG family protein [Salmonella enterica]
MRNKFAGFLFLWVVSCNASALSPVALKDGINKLDLNQDGKADYIVVAQFDNNTSHPNLGLTFFVNRPEGGMSIMPVTNSDTFTWFDYRLSAAADFLIADNRLFREGKVYFLVTAQKSGANLFDPAQVELTFYRFSESRDDPGVPLYEWKKVKTQLTTKQYQSASLAYQDIDGGILLK